MLIRRNDFKCSFLNSLSTLIQTYMNLKLKCSNFEWEAYMNLAISNTASQLSK